MIVTLIGKSAIASTALPDKISGQYWLELVENGKRERWISIEGVENEWLLKSGRKATILDAAEKPVSSAVIGEGSIHVVKTDAGERMYVFAEPATEDRRRFTKYLVPETAELTIGKDAQSGICFQSKLVSSAHARLTCRGGQWRIRDEGSSNGTFVNESRVTDAALSAGDTVFIMGLKIIVGRGFLALNNPDGQVTVNSSELHSFLPQEAEPEGENENEDALPEKEAFYRSPRFKRDIKTAKFKIDSPPQSPVSEEIPWLLAMGSSFAMGAMSLVTLANAAVTGNMISMAMGGSMLLGTVLLPTVTKRYEKKRKLKKEALRQKKYREYLDSVAVAVNEECQLQKEILCENHISTGECERRILEGDRKLWERSPGQNDFLQLRVGRGEKKLDAEFSYSERKFSLDDDNLQEELYNLCERPRILSDIPITYSLFENHISGVIGTRKQSIELAKALIFQIAALYSYDEVKLVFLYDEEEEEQFEFVKWLPHVWSEDGGFRFVATNANEAKEVSAHLEKIAEARSELNPDELEKAVPYYVIFSMSKALAARTELVKQILTRPENLHFSVVAFYDELKSLPKECSMVVELDGAGGRLFDKNNISGESTAFSPETGLSNDSLKLSTRLANVFLEQGTGGYQLPGTITFLELFGVGKVEHLNALTRWKENDPTRSLEAAVGVDSLGEAFKLDLHEKFHGPHGLVAGMTGSGKSEFIITYILSLAVNYHPNEVAFILIDYKGGGMAKSFESLPHTAGIITNLDGAAIKRSLVSIESELKRRQAIFAQVSKRIHTSNIDIYKYQKLYREGVVTEPLQHLFIISDEFAELKTQQPEFMAQLVSAARIGRSLGVHLILATQKPSGVVDDQIWSNSKFRVCLKVQERADSMDMLKRPDAAELTDTGRFYLQVGYNELFEIGQSAWAGASYSPSERVLVEKDNSVSVVDRNGHVIRQAKLEKKHPAGGENLKQLDAVTGYLRKIAEEENIKIRPLWLDPIPALILLEDMKKKYPSSVSESFVLNPVIGEYDDPERQRQCILRLPLSKEGNAVIYGAAGSGKTSFLNAMIYSLLSEHSPEEVNLYLLDFASETLRAFADAPHVGDVVLSYESEKVANLFKMLHAEIGRRKKLFADYGGDYASYLASSEKKLPAIVVAIHNFSAFSEMYGEAEETVALLSREGTKYGVYFVLTSLTTGGVRFRLLQNFKQLIALQMNDETDYSSIVGKTEGLLPSRYKGRGLIKQDGLFEFQTAMLTKDAVPFSFIQGECRRLKERFRGCAAAPKIPVLPEKVDIDFLLAYWDASAPLSVPIGVETGSMRTHRFRFQDHYITLALSSGGEYQAFLGDLVRMMQKRKPFDMAAFDVSGALAPLWPELPVCRNAEECGEKVSELFETLVFRNNSYKDAADPQALAQQFSTLFVVINSLSALRSVLTEEENEKLSALLEKGAAEYKVYFLIGEQAKNAASYSYEKWYKAQISQTDGIWIGEGFTEQYLLKAQKAGGVLREELSPGFGYSLQNGRCSRLKLLNEAAGEDEYER